MNVKIAVAFHKPTWVDNYIKNKDIYVPIYSGNDWNTDMLKDNTGINCADLNREINLITQLYWFANRLEEFGNPDYIGLHHYRRFLRFDVHDLNPNTIQATYFAFSHGFNVYNQLTFIESSIQNCEAFFNNYLLFHPEDIPLFNQFLKEEWFYACNLFIMPRKIFEEYFEYMKFLIDLCAIFKRNKPQILDNRPRILSMYFERMTGFFLYKKLKEGVNIQRCPIIVPEVYYNYILRKLYSGYYYIYKHNRYYRINDLNYYLKELA